MSKNAVRTVSPASFYMRWFLSQTAKGVDLGSFSLSLCFSFNSLKIYRTFVFFAKEAAENSRVFNLPPNTNNIYSDKSVFPQSVHCAISEAVDKSFKNTDIDLALVEIIYPVNKMQADNFELEAEIQSNGLARIATENRKCLRDGLRKAVLKTQGDYNTHAGY